MAIHIEMMEENYLTADILGIALADEDQTLFIPFALQSSQMYLKHGFGMKLKRNIASDSKAALASMARYGFQIKGIEFDLLLAAYIVSPSTIVHGRCLDCKRIWLYGSTTR